MILDVREKNELESEGRVDKALNIPISELDNNLSVIRELAQSLTIELLCRSGTRAQIAKEKIEKDSSESLNLKIITDGIKGIADGKIIRERNKSSISIMRQVLIIAGLMIAAFSTVALTINSIFIWAPLLIGTALFLAGLSGICPMAILLGKMPWNK